MQERKKVGIQLVARLATGPALEEPARLFTVELELLQLAENYYCCLGGDTRLGFRKFKLEKD
jgi:hypothetical protein